MNHIRAFSRRVCAGFVRRMQLLRGYAASLCGAEAGQAFGLGPQTQIAGHSCLRVGDHVSIEGYSYLNCYSSRGVTIGSHTSIDRYLWLHCGGTSDANDHGWVEIGRHSYIGPYAVIGAGGGIHIGDDVLIGPFVCLNAENHNHRDSHHLIREQGVAYQGISIEDDVWIGARVSVLDGVTIGRGAVVGAGAVVTRSVEPYTIVAGVPAKVISKRGETSS